MPVLDIDAIVCLKARFNARIKDLERNSNADSDFSESESELSDAGILPCRPPLTQTSKGRLTKKRLRKCTNGRQDTCCYGTGSASIAANTANPTVFNHAGRYQNSARHTFSWLKRE
ncbi:hypothetical protein FN846DRAFT_1022304 [Sphaerosporella brunnea]|uniref:Uncharacterized protein n=1 Tax=Sphaerosporella brunnea TaxID=1250544 RepID=A0A5J5ETR4_9PEZI|nr:hypothetical protein FN846DRAFT_1022304 [Sphaerosporella brunnea]